MRIGGEEMSEVEKTKIEELQEKAKEGARSYFREGLNCSECVFKSYLDLGVSGFPPEVVALSSGFGGGIGMTKNTCGALLGAVLCAGTKKGRKNPLEKETPMERIEELNGEKGLYSTFAALTEEFNERYGTVSCRELTDPHGDWHSRERKKSCQEIIGYAAALGVKYALDEER